MIYYLYNPYAKSNKASHIIQKHALKPAIDISNQDSMNSLIKQINIDDEIYVFGGDGTLQHFIQNYPQLLTNKIYFYPNGSANDFSRTLKNDYPYYYSIKDQQGNLDYFINGIGIGFDALICDNVNNAKSKSSLSYGMQAFKSIMSYKPIDIELEIDNQIETYHKVWLCSLQNSPYFGGGIKIANKADITEKEIDLVIAHDLNRLQVLFLLFVVIIGKAHRLKKVFFTKKINNFKVTTTKPVLIQLDGNTKIIDTPLTLQTAKQLKLVKAKPLSE